MNERPLPLPERRRLLCERAAQQRQQMSSESRALAAPVANVQRRIERGLHTLNELKRHPAWIVGGVMAVLLLIKPRRLGAVANVVHKTSRGWRTVAPVLMPLLAPAVTRVMTRVMPPVLTPVGTPMGTPVVTRTRRHIAGPQ